MTIDRWREVVERGYDRIGDRYLRLRPSGPDAGAAFLASAIAGLPEGGVAVDLGCGPGRPVTAALSRRGVAIGVDRSTEQLRLAAREAPNARLVRADLTSVAFRPRSVDLVTAFHVFNHVPGSFLSPVLRSIAGWLRDEGSLVASFPNTRMPDSIEDDWLGVPMFFAGLNAHENLELVERSGFDIIRSEVVTSTGPDGEPERFLWIVARQGGWA